jgi:tetratricopeptide (TPR) repeat protein
MAQKILRDYLQETEDAISRGQHDNALARCQSVLASYPESLDAQRLLGEVYLAQGQLDDAQQAFDWVLTNDPENVVAYCDRALISERLSDYDTALDCYQQAYELSRGNSQIRQAFNKLSAKSGQQGFMFSRAGLARLYMRGDLLTQAIQEWEAVLAANAERLDARTGLLETYWREGLYNQVEQQAKQILQDVPGCIKALLLLAYVISARDMLQARELLRKVEGLDPDLNLAHDLLADAMASQPNDPFLQLLRKPPVMVDTALEQSSATGALSQGSRLQEAGVNAKSGFAQSAVGMANSQDLQVVPDWTSIDASWNNIAGLKDLEESLAGQEVSTLPWSSNTYTGSEVWNGADNSVGATGEQKMPDFVAQLGERNSPADAWSLPAQEATSQSGNARDEVVQAEPWMSLQETLGTLSTSGFTSDASGSSFADSSGAGTSDMQSWNQSSSFSEAGFDGTWGSGQDARDANIMGDWSTAVKDDQPSPPAWLSMLTQNDRKQMSGEIASLASTVQEPKFPAVPAPASVEQQRPVEPERPQQVERQAQKAEVEPEEQEDESLFGPEWLKSLGAASMDAAFLASAELPAIRVAPAESSSSERKAPSQPLVRANYEPEQQAEPVVPPSSQASGATWASEQLATPAPPVQETNPPKVPTMQETFSAIAQELSAWPGETDGQDVLKTLEALEQELRLHGFRHLEPNTLAAIARNEGEIEGALSRAHALVCAGGTTGPAGSKAGAGSRGLCI